MWFLRGTCFCKRWFGVDETPDSAVAPVWFHVVPYLEGVPKFVFAKGLLENSMVPAWSLSFPLHVEIASAR